MEFLGHENAPTQALSVASPSSALLQSEFRHIALSQKGFKNPNRDVFLHSTWSITKPCYPKIPNTIAYTIIDTGYVSTSNNLINNKNSKKI